MRRFTHHKPALLKLARQFHKDRLPFLIIGMFVMLLTFGFSMAKSGSSLVQLPNNALLAEENLSDLAVDMSFEAKQVARDFELINKAINDTEISLKSSNFSCEALTQAKQTRSVLSLFLTNTTNINTRPTAENIYLAYDQYTKIRGTDQQSGLRQTLYGGYNPITAKNERGLVSLLSTCKQIATTVNKSCSAYNDLSQQLSRSKSAATSAENETLKTLRSRCTSPHTVLSTARITVSDLTPQSTYEKNCRDVGMLATDVLFNTDSILSKNTTTMCSTLIEKYVGPSGPLKKIKQIR